MRAVAVALLVCAGVLSGARLFTGVVYAADEPVTYLVLRAAPGLEVERTEPHAGAGPGGLVLDREEPTLAYGAAYLGLMRAAPLLAAACLASSWLAWRGRQPART